MQNKYKILTILLFMVGALPQGVSAPKSEFERFKAQFTTFAENEKKEFADYKLNLRKELAQYKAQVTGVWGYADVSSGSRLVVYSQDMNEKVLIDYAADEIFYSSIKPSNLKQAETLLNNTLNASIADLKNGMSLSSKKIKKYDPSKGLTVADSLGISQSELKALVKSVAKRSIPVKEVERVEENIKALVKAKKKVEAYIQTLPVEKQLPERMFLNTFDVETSNALKHQQQVSVAPEKKQPATRKIKFSSTQWKKTTPYRRYVSSQANKYNLSPALLYAIMETESSFNPMAQSPIPAFGLMQVVPTSAGIDVNDYLNKSKTPPHQKTLLVPETNVEFGSTYMNLLVNRYFSPVKNETSKIYVAIAAYNTGPGNVAYVFNDKSSKKLKPAYKAINQLAPQEVYNKLRANAHPETQGYIQKVLKAKKYYEQFI
ncbi:transglycosylase SLT domain-containing protein [Psychrosphaera sp. 1_MG-2023]|uniref:transglycosylase SLT domain-containing protein n=1 Tax=Psychrosphaera sp. 1_MG-2023 TaxID=3062643 RepID=UPI0026E155AE|nr:transglycosylase SLT domain-containing protein [Psychrosphaera sp. 1_MG-2023]MDO6719037.1 transglycosylase SLT domain-containing protein [Psychrosphaera sp. 1_MG-2023]